MDTSQRRELNRGFGEGFTRSFELALAPVLFGLLGWWLDSVFGIFPVLTLTFGLLGVVGVFVKAWYTYAHDMSEHEKEREARWAKRS